MSISGISWGVMRPEFGGKNITTSYFLGFHQSRKVGTASKFVTKDIRFGGGGFVWASYFAFKNFFRSYEKLTITSGMARLSRNASHYAPYTAFNVEDLP